MSDHVEGVVAERSALDQADLVAAERGLTEADAFGPSPKKTMYHRAIALASAEHEASAAARDSEAAASVSDAAASASKAAASACEEVVSHPTVGVHQMFLSPSH